MDITVNCGHQEGQLIGQNLDGRNWRIELQFIGKSEVIVVPDSQSFLVSEANQ